MRKFHLPGCDKDDCSRELLDILQGQCDNFRGRTPMFRAVSPSDLDVYEYPVITKGLRTIECDLAFYPDGQRLRYHPESGHWELD